MRKLVFVQQGDKTYMYDHIGKYQVDLLRGWKSRVSTYYELEKDVYTGSSARLEYEIRKRLKGHGI